MNDELNDGRVARNVVLVHGGFWTARDGMAFTRDSRSEAFTSRSSKIRPGRLRRMWPSQEQPLPPRTALSSS